jgi:hypothetical protein
MAAVTRRSDIKHPVRVMLNSAADRARRKKVPFTLHRGDVSIPDLCPILGIPLAHRRSLAGGPSNNSPSLICKIPSKGYVPGNVIVVSLIAARIKGMAAMDQIERVLSWMKKLEEETPCQ